MNDEGQVTVDVEMDDNNTGKGPLEFKDSDGEVLESIGVEVGDDENIADCQIEELQEYEDVTFGVDRDENV